MTRDDIIRMAHEAGMRKTFVCKNPADCPDDDDCCHTQSPEGLHGRPEVIERFANLIAAAEREACAKAMDEMAEKDNLSNYYKVAANAIRAREEQA